MRTIRVLVTVQVSEWKPETNIDQETMEDAAVNAVENALRQAEQDGIRHEYLDLGINFVDAILYEDEIPD